MLRIFLDASVLFSAAYSSTGSSRALIREAIRGNLTLVVSPEVLEETKRNLEKKAPHVLDSYIALLSLLKPEIVETPSQEDVWEAEEYVHSKDAFIIAAAKKAKPDYLTTWDREHLLKVSEVAKESGLIIITPDELMAVIRERSGSVRKQ